MKEKINYLIIGFFAGIIISFIFMFYFIGILNPFSFFANYYFKVSEINITLDSEAREIANFCSVFKNKEVVDCVLAQVPFKYNDSKDRPLLKTIKQVKETGGNCRDYSVIYSSIFRMLGFNTHYRFLPNHVYITISKQEPKWFYCNIDNGEAKCYEEAS